jgi:charged multivesicular body protein 7
MTSLKPALLDNLPAFVPAPSALRLQALYASTSAQSLSNPSGYEANVRWWASVLHELLRNGYLNGEKGDRLVLKVDEDLLSRLEGGPGLGRPKGLAGVLVRHVIYRACSILSS